MRGILWVAGCLLAIGCIAAAGPSGRRVTPAQAADAVRAFEGNRTLQLPQPRGETDVLKRAMFVFSTHGGPMWKVDAQTGSVVNVFYHVPAPYPLPKKVLPESRIVQIARDFAMKHFPAFMKRPLCERVSGAQFLFVAFQEYLPANGALSGNFVSVDVESASGRIGGASILDLPVPSAATARPRVTRQQAVDASLRAAHLPSTAKVERAELGWQRAFGARPAALVWRVEVSGTAIGSGYNHRVVTVDALTGRFLHSDGFR